MVAYLLPNPAAPGFIPSILPFPTNLFIRNFDVAKATYVDINHLVLACGKPVLQEINLKEVKKVINVNR